MSEAEVKLEAPKEQDPLEKERLRIATLLFEKSITMTADYKKLVMHAGSLVSASMAFAYSKAFNDCVKLVLKENQKGE